MMPDLVHHCILKPRAVPGNNKCSTKHALNELMNETEKGFEEEKRQNARI